MFGHAGHGNLNPFILVKKAGAVSKEDLDKVRKEIEIMKKIETVFDANSIPNPDTVVPAGSFVVSEK